MNKSEEHKCRISQWEAVRTTAAEIQEEAEAATNPRTTKVVDRQHNEMLIHEHDLVPIIINGINCFHCDSCGTNYCQLCGKSLDDNKFEYK